MKVETAEQQFTVAFGRGTKGPWHTRTVSRSELWARLTAHIVEPAKLHAEAIVPGELAPCPTPCRNAGKSGVNCGGGQSHRLAKNIKAISLFGADIDKQPQALIDQLLAELNRLGLAYVYYTTWSHRPPEEASARLVFPLSRPYAVTDPRHWKTTVWPMLMRMVGLDPDAAVKVDSQCSDASRLFFLPSVSGEAAPRQVIVHDGTPIDVDLLPEAPTRPQFPQIVPLDAQRMVREAHRDVIMPQVLASAERPEDVELLAAVAEGRGFPEGERHNSLLRVTLLLAKHCGEYSDETLLSVLKPTLDACGDEDWRTEAETMLAGGRTIADELQAEDLAFQAHQNELRGDAEGYAARFVRLYGDIVRSTDETGFIVWDGQRWASDPKGSRALRIGAEMAGTYESDLEVLRQTLTSLQKQLLTAVDPAKQKLAARIESLAKYVDGFRSNVIKPCRQTHSIRAFLELVRSRVMAKPEWFDADPWVLNCTNGILDLRAGALDPHVPEHACSRMTAAAYDPDARAPLFLRTLEQALPDIQVRGLFQRAIGYALTGAMSEDLLFILLGDGGNGKSTLLNGIQEAVGDYAGPAPKSLLIDSRFAEAQTYQLADLRGKRLVHMMELKQREYMDSSRLKSIVGGDKIIAARKFENQISFTTQAKVFMPCNTKPRLNDEDNGAWRRIALIEFPKGFLADEERNKELRDQLLLEKEGILAWAVRGCLEWQRIGLAIPEVCKQAVAEYRREENYLAQFVEDRVERGEGTISSARLYDAYREWSQQEGVQPLSNTAFSMKLRKLGFQPQRTAAARMWLGIKGLLV